MSNFWLLIKLLYQLLPQLLLGIRQVKDIALDVKIKKEGNEIRVIFNNIKAPEMRDEDFANEARKLNDMFRN